MPNIFSFSAQPCWVNRGDPSVWDWEIGDLTCDGNWHDLDCSLIVPAAARFIKLHAQIYDDVVGRWIVFRKKGNVNDKNMSWCRTAVIGYTNYEDLIIPCDVDQIIEYMATDTVITTINILVQGWVF